MKNKQDFLVYLHSALSYLFEIVFFLRNMYKESQKELNRNEDLKEKQSLVSFS